MAYWTTSGGFVFVTILAGASLANGVFRFAPLPRTLAEQELDAETARAAARVMRPAPPTDGWRNGRAW